MDRLKLAGLWRNDRNKGEVEQSDVSFAATELMEPNERPSGAIRG